MGKLLDKLRRVQAGGRPFCTMIVPAAGSSARMGGGDKLMMELEGVPVLVRTLRALDAAQLVDEIIIATREDRLLEVADLCRRCGLRKPVRVVQGGENRTQSVLAAACEADAKAQFIAVHDGARPLVTVDLITHAINALKGNLDADGVVVGHPSIDTLKVVNGRSIVGTPDRTAFWIAQTPQVFRAKIARRAYKEAMFEGFVGTDDSSLVERIGGRVMMLEGPRDNIKVTVPEDVGPVVAALSARVGQR